MALQTDILNEIKASWKLDAKSEDTERYFFHVSEVEAIQCGEKAYVIGRKGTGKTAIAQYLLGVKSHEIFASILSFKNFPFNDLYALKNAGFTAPNQYITLWKYLIYCNVARLMSKNQGIASSIREPLEKLYKPEPIEYLQRSVGKWTATDFNFSILGTGAGAKGQRINNDSNWIERTQALESIIAEHIDDSKYLILFDELDEDYRYMTEVSRYQNFSDLLTGLFKAIQDIKSVFRHTHAQIFPVIFLRDDIYDTLEDPDKTKWDDAKIDLDWTVDRLKQLLAFRISRTRDPQASSSMHFGDAWSLIFGAIKISYGDRQNKNQSTFEYILKSTQLRPRDVIRYLTEYAKVALDTREKLSERTVKLADHAFSGYLKRELQDEIGGVVPHVAKLFDVLSILRKQTFSHAEFAKAYEQAVQKDFFERYDPAWVLKILFFFSVIGNQPRQLNQTVFRYRNHGAELNFNESIVVHRGLLKSLQIL